MPLLRLRPWGLLLLLTGLLLLLAGGLSYLLVQARDLIAAMPVTDAEAAAPEMRAAFTGGKQKTARQAELEQQWAAFAKEKYAAAKAKAEEGLKLVR